MAGMLRVTRVLLVGEPTIGAVQFEAWPRWTAGSVHRRTRPTDSLTRVRSCGTGPVHPGSKLGWSLVRRSLVAVS